VHLKSFVKRNLAEGSLVFAGILILVTQFAVTKYFLNDGGADHTQIVGAPLDDTYIHCRYAENLRSGRGYTFNPEVNIDDSLYKMSSSKTVSADTSPLWVAMIAVGGIFSRHLDLIAILLSAFFYLLLAPAVFRICRFTYMLPYSWSVVGGIITMLCSRLIWSSASGMETTLACFLTLIIFHEHLKQRQLGGVMRLREGLFLALGIAVRPELMFLAFIVLMDWFIVAIRERRGFTALVKAKIFFLICVAPVYMIPYFENGGLIYHSSVVQGARFSFLPDIGYLFFVAKTLAASFSLPILFAFIAPLKEKKHKDIILLQTFGFGLLILLAFIAPQFRHHGRYFFEVFPILIILGIITISMLLEIKIRSKVVFYMQGLLILIALIGTTRGVLLAAESVTNINDQHLAVCSWIKENTGASDKLAVDDVGAIGYFTKRNVIDLTGLVSPEFFPLQNDQKQVWKQARKEGANVFIIYTRLNPSFYQYAKDSLDFVKEFRVRLPLVASADTVMSVFRIKQDLHAAR